MSLYYEDDQVTLYQGDCREISGWLDADVLVTDPPYGMSLNSNWKGQQGDMRIEGDADTGARDAVLAAWGGRPALVFSRWNLPLPNARQRLTWDKGEHVGMGDLTMPWKPNTEDIYVFGRGFSASKRGSSVLRSLAIAGCVGRNNTGQRHHATEKPIALMETLVSACPAGVIADPFAGGGSTLVAARNLGRKVIGVELEERYCETIAKRLSQDCLDLASLS